jgi:hypothetical protein
MATQGASAITGRLSRRPVRNPFIALSRRPARALAAADRPSTPCRAVAQQRRIDPFSPGSVKVNQSKSNPPLPVTRPSSLEGVSAKCALRVNLAVSQYAIPSAPTLANQQPPTKSNQIQPEKIYAPLPVWCLEFRRWELRFIPHSAFRTPNSPAPRFRLIPGYSGYSRLIRLFL